MSTLTWFILCMSPHVCGQGIISSKALLTILTLKRSIICVNANVVYQMICFRKEVPTVLTLIQFMFILAISMS